MLSDLAFFTGSFSHDALAGILWFSVIVLAYVHVGYPVLMYVAGRALRPDASKAPPQGQPHVSLVIPAYNEEQVIRQKVENSLALDYPKNKLEILVISDGSTDKTVEVARVFVDRGVRVLQCPDRCGKTQRINEAVQQCNGEVFCLCDANVIFRVDALRRLIACLDNPRVGAATGDVQLVGGASTFSRGEPVYYRIERAIQFGESQIGSAIGVDGGMYVVRKELFRPLAPDTILDDFVTTMNVIRQGRRVVYVPDACATEDRTPTARAEFRRRVRVAAGAVQSVRRGNWPSPLKRPIEFWQFVSHKLLRWLGPVWLILVLVTSVLLWSYGWEYRVVMVGQVALYTLAVAATVYLPVRETRIGGVVFYLVMSHIAMGVGLVKGLLNLQHVAWNRTERTAVGSASALAAKHRQER